ncbi:putative acyl- dehydrogenase [Rosellinia necatrix]|uniref:Putative acyl-dehydrogenase n=1 Tax=Rosellinia necatrix TaxID=77044 RepID=A0A1S7ULK1_ROSNE|nr:putative acyl- dehydrogenase [Rosellinia necatrix]
MEPSSANTGFFQPQPTLKNQFLHDPSIQRVFKLFLPADIARAVAPEITRLGDEVLQQHVFDWVTDAERNPPYVAGGGRNAFGQPVSTKLVLTEGWRKLQDFSIEKGFVSQGYEEAGGLGRHARVVQYLRQLLFESSSANVGCPAAMADGAAKVLRHHLRRGDDDNENDDDDAGLSAEERKVFRNAYEHLVSRDPATAWTSGQWMTERAGGSDVSRTETIATYEPLPPPPPSSSSSSSSSSATPLCDPAEGIPLGPWRIDGFKWFSSATDSNMTILLAQTAHGTGLSAFYAPTRRHNPSLTTPSSSSSGGGPNGDGTELNGVTITRLKSKMGTRPLPTAELELRGMRGWLLGREGRGVHEIAAVLTVTRVRSAVSAAGHASRGLSVARAFAAARAVGAGRGRRVRLADSALHVRTLADMAIEHHAMMLLTFYGAYLLGLDEHPLPSPSPSSSSTTTTPSSSPSSSSPSPSVLATITPPRRLVAPLLRVATPLLKAYVTKRAVPLVHGCMEALGGVGYLEGGEAEHLNVARLFRDACVLGIWEGTTDVLATDVVRALKHPAGGGGESVEALDWVLSSSRDGDGDGDGDSAVRQKWALLKAEIEGGAQEDLVPDARRILWTLAELLMAVLFALDVRSDDGPAVREMYRRYCVSRGLAAVAGQGGGPDGTRARLELDQAIVFGEERAVMGESKL